MMAGAVQGVVGFYDHTIDLQAKGKFVESVVQFSQAPGEVELVSAKMADQIKSPADFKGKSLGVTGLGSSTNFLTQYLAVKSGVELGRIHLGAGGRGNTFIAAMQQGEIEAGMTTEPTISRMLKTGEAKILIDMRSVADTRAALGGVYPAACLYMQTVLGRAAQDGGRRSWPTPSSRRCNTSRPTAAGDRRADAEGLLCRRQGPVCQGAGRPASRCSPPTERCRADGPPTVLEVLSAFDKTVKGKTDRFVQDLHHRFRRRQRAK